MKWVLTAHHAKSGEELGVRAASCWHVRSKQDLLSLVAEEIWRRCVNLTGFFPGVIG
jgi:hypothetical protein